MTNFSEFSTAIEDRFLEDYVAGCTYFCGSIEVTESEIVTFARTFDPQPFHVDPHYAERSVFNGIIASGWHTASLMMRLFVDNYLSHVASLSSPGVDELFWLKPVRPGDKLSLTVTVMDTVRSRSKLDRGVLESFIEMSNQSGEVVMTMKALNILAYRP